MVSDFSYCQCWLHKTINNSKKSQNASSFTKQNTDFCPSVSIFLGLFHLILQKCLSDYNSFHADHTQETCLIKLCVTGTSILKHLLNMNLQRTGLRLLRYICNSIISMKFQHCLLNKLRQIKLKSYTKY